MYYFIQLVAKLRTQATSSVLVTKGGKVTVQGTTTSTSHTINQEERSQFTAHINGVSFPEYSDTL